MKQSWPAKSAGGVKWSFCLNAAMIAVEQERLLPNERSGFQGADSSSAANTTGRRPLRVGQSG